jgi:hypothetical protein
MIEWVKKYSGEDEVFLAMVGDVVMFRLEYQREVIINDSKGYKLNPMIPTLKSYANDIYNEAWGKSVAHEEFTKFLKRTGLT